MRKRLLALLAILLSFAMLAAACGDDDDAGGDAGDDTATEDDSGDDMDDDEPAEDDDESTADMSDVAEDAEDSDAGDSGAVDSGPVAGGTLLIQSSQVPRHLNGTVQSGYATAVPGTQLNASPLLFDENFQPQPYLAESWEIADDGLSVTLNLVQGAVFHDGEPITSEDVKFSLETSQANHPFRTMFAAVSSVDTPDDHTVVINLSEPHPAILLAMSPGLLPVIPEHVYNDGQEIKEHPCNAGTDCFVGSGPFTLAEYEAGSIIRLEKFEDFFIPERPYLDEIIIEIVPDPASIVLGLENGDTDLSATLGGAANVVRLQDNDDVIVTADGHAAVGPIQWLEFNLSDPDLSNVVVRQAIADGVDREFLADVIDQGTTFPATTGIHPGSPFHNPDTEHYGAGIEAAQARLSDAGIDPSSISFAVDYIPPAQLAYAEYIVQVLGDIGFDAQLNTVPDFPTWAGRVAAGEHQMTINNVWNWGDPVIGVHRTYLSTNNVGVIWTNNTGYNSAEVDDLLAQAGAEFDFDTRVDLYGQAQEIINQDVPIVFLTTPPFWQAFQPRVQNPPIGVWGQLGPMHEVWLAE